MRITKITDFARRVRAAFTPHADVTLSREMCHALQACGHECHLPRRAQDLMVEYRSMW